MPATYWRAGDDVSALAEEIIGDHHPHLAEARIFFLFRDEAQETRGKVVLGKASKMSEKESAIAGEHFDFKIELAHDYWKPGSPAFRRALLDHELCHCDAEEDEDGKLVYKMRSHDVEEFTAIIERHGAWKDDLREFCDAVQQLDLFEGATGAAVERIHSVAAKYGGRVEFSVSPGRA
jgi:hypothetical protein